MGYAIAFVIGLICGASLGVWLMGMLLAAVATLEENNG